MAMSRTNKHNTLKVFTMFYGALFGFSIVVSLAAI